MQRPPPFINRLGVVVIGRNEGERLIACLSGMVSHLGGTVADRLLYVDSGSSDGSLEAVERLGVSVLKLDPSRPFTAARGRNEGFAALTAPALVEFVQFVDGDCLMNPGWWEPALTFMAAHPAVAIVCGRLREMDPASSVYHSLCQMEWDAPRAGETDQCGGIALVRSKAFAEAGGYRADLAGGEEPELCVRLQDGGWRIWRLDTEMAVHDAATISFARWWRRTVRNGAGFLEVHLMHRNSSHAVWQRETARALAWGGMLPAMIALGSLVHPAAAALALAYPAQVVRIAKRQGLGRKESWRDAFFITLGKFAEFVGILRFVLHHLQKEAGAEARPGRRRVARAGDDIRRGAA